MKWTNKLPTEPGLYVWRIGKGCEPSFVRLDRCYDTLSKKALLLIGYPVFSTLTRTPADLGGQWAGPIEEPDEIKEELSNDEQH